MIEVKCLCQIIGRRDSKPGACPACNDTGVRLVDPGPKAPTYVDVDCETVMGDPNTLIRLQRPIRVF